MTTLSSFIESLRYDLRDYEEGIRWGDKEILVYINRIIDIIDSKLAVVDSDLLFGTETNIDTVESQDYVDITNINNGYWSDVIDVWIGQDKLERISVPQMYYNRKFKSSDEKPYRWALEGKHILFESGADDDHTDVVIHYQKTTRPRLASWSDTFTAAAATDLITISPAATFVSGDGRFQLTTTDTLPAGLAASTDYWLIYDASNGGTTYQLANSESNAVGESEVDITDTGTGTHTITHTEYMPYNGEYNSLIREMVVGHATAKATGRGRRGDALWTSIANKRVYEIELRRHYVPRPYYIDF